MLTHLKMKMQPVAVAEAFNASTYEAEVGGFQWVQGQHGLDRSLRPVSATQQDPISKQTSKQRKREILFL